MINKWTVGGGIWLLSLVLVAWLTWDYVTAKADQDKLEAVQSTIEQANQINAENRELEQSAQEDINNALTTQYHAAVTRGNRLASQLASLQHRASRAASHRSGEVARAACTGATGAELSAEDGGFLAGEAARADELRDALRACYVFVDAVDRLRPEKRGAGRSGGLKAARRNLY